MALHAVAAQPSGLKTRVVEPGNFPDTSILDNRLRSTQLVGTPVREVIDAFRAQLRGAQPRTELAPDSMDVARAIARAIHDPEAPFWVPVGADAELISAWRRPDTFEKYVATLRSALGAAQSEAPTGRGHA